MISLFNASASDFHSNGDMVLQPTSCQISAELNGAWSLQLEHPFDSIGRWRWILPDCILKVPSFNGEQLFRIQSTQKTLSSITAIAAPIFLDSAKEVFLTDVRPTKKNGQQALDILLKNTRYSGLSDIKKVETSYYEYKSLGEALTGNDDNSFINRWGGEVIYDNYTIHITERAGKDNHVNVFYGKNLLAVDESVDYSEIITRIYPKGYNGRSMSNHGYVASPTQYPFARCKTITYSDIALAGDVNDHDEQLTICSTQAELDVALAKRSREEFASGLDKPAVSISVDLAMLYGTAEYQLYRELETISLGDVIHCKHSAINIDSMERVVSLVYDCIRKQISKCTIGSKRYSFINRIAQLTI